MIKTIWHILGSLFLWFNLISSPFLILWPELNDEKNHRNLYYLLWLNELYWVLDIVRKMFDPPSKSQMTDVYEVAINYIKSTLILDVTATLP